MLFGQHGTDEADQRVAVGEDPDDVGAAADLLVEPFLGVVRPDLAPDLLGERGERQQVRAGLLEVGGDLRELVSQRTDDPIYWAATDSASGWSNTECSSVRTHGHDAFGVIAIRFVV